MIQINTHRTISSPVSWDDVITTVETQNNVFDFNLWVPFAPEY